MVAGLEHVGAEWHVGVGHAHPLVLGAVGQQGEEEGLARAEEPDGEAVAPTLRPRLRAKCAKNLPTKDDFFFFLTLRKPTHKIKKLFFMLR